jgi:hydroxymethylglutaryl-CoA reductase
MEVSLRQMTMSQRLNFLAEKCDLTESELNLLRGKGMSTEIAENLIENSIGYFPIPMGLATHFHIDGRDVLVPMAVEETSIIAACSAAAKWIRNEGEITTATQGNLIIGQIQLPQVKSVAETTARLTARKAELIEAANAMLPGLVARGGGVRELAFRDVPRADGAGNMLVIHVLCDPCDAMGANLINQVCEGLKSKVQDITEEHVGLCILSNLVDSKLATAQVRLRNIDAELGQGIVEAMQFAESDPYRATTHNKGVLNGIDPILIATGNDWRAVEAGVHAYASRSGRYQPVTSWKMEGNDLIGRIELPMALGTVGGVTRIHPFARISLKILKIEHADELARICAAVGLVQNLAALKALSTVGIVRGHMELHAANLALAAGSTTDEIPWVRKKLLELIKQKKNIGISVAQDILRELRAQALELKG